MTAPFVGPPTDAPGCAWSAAIDQPACGGRAVVHIASLGPWGVVMLESCHEHAPTARVAGDLIAEHPYGFGCDTGLCWPMNANAVPDVHVYRSRRKAARAAIRRVLGRLLTWSMVITAMSLDVVVSTNLEEFR